MAKGDETKKGQKKGKSGKKAKVPKDHASSSSKGKNIGKPKTVRPTPFSGGGAKFLSWLEPGKVIQDYWKDSRLHDKRLQINQDGSAELITLKFTFNVENEAGTGYQQVVADGPGYLAFLQERKNKHSSNQEKDSWNALVEKLRTRIGLKMQIDKPALFGAKAKALVLSFLTSFERALMNQSQKDWSQIDVTKLGVEHAKYGKPSLEQRFKTLKTVLNGAPLEEAQFKGKENTPKRTKDVFVMLKKDITVDVPRAE